MRGFRTVKGLHLARLSSGVSVKDALRSYRHDPDVLYAEPNYIVHALTQPNDPHFPDQWGLRNSGQDGGTQGADIHAPQAWDITQGSQDVVVAVIDTGIDYNHPDLAPNMLTTTYCNPDGTDGSGGFGSCYGIAPVYDSSDPMDDFGHGTHVAGIIGAVGNNSLGIAGVNWNVKQLACKFLDSTGTGSMADAITCLDYVKMLKDHGVNIIATNNSWGGNFSSQALVDAVTAQEQDGILFIAAAGNGFDDNDVVSTYPASIFLPNVIPVAATNRFDALAAFSNVGRRTVDLGAPGEDILSTLPGAAYGTMSGTSMAAPHVTGVAALLAAQDSNRDWRAIKNLILTGGDSIPALAQTITGKHLNAYGSMTCSNSTISERLQPSLDSVFATVGQPLTLAALNISCGQPAGPVQVTVTPGGQVINLLDDGAAPDQAARDGIYTGQWAPSGLGNYTLAFSNGQTVQATVLRNYTVGETDFHYQTITGTNLNVDDDSVATITAPFPVQFGGGQFSTLYISSNGTISFTNAFGDFINWYLPLNYLQLINGQNPPPPAIDQPVVTLVAPFWSDLYPVKGTDQNVFWDVTGAAPNRHLIIEWRNVRTYDCHTESNTTVTFEVVFPEESGNFWFNYSNVVFGGSCSSQDYGATATIGMEVTQNVGTQWSMDELAVANGMSLLWTLAPSNPGSNPAPTVTSLSPSSIPAGSADTWLTMRGTGFLPTSYASTYGYPPRFVTEYVSSTELKVLIPVNTISSLNGGDFRISVTNPPPGGGTAGATLTITPAVPVITSISPSSVPAGSFGFVLTISGSNFYFGTDVWWNDTAAQSTFVNPSQITFPVPGYLLTNAGTVTIKVQNAVNTFSNAVTFTITSPSTPAAISAPSPLATAGAPTSPGVTKPRAVLLPGRFQGWKYTAQRGIDYLAQFARRRAGLATPNAARWTEAGPLVQGASPPSPPPGFNFRPTLPAGFLPTAVVTGDLNGDGHVDWAVANGGNDNIWIYLGKGDGTSQIPTIIPLKGQAPTALAVADINQDGKLDLIVGEADSGSVGVLLGNGDGTFGPERKFYVPGLPEGLAVADFNRDGNLDVVVGLFGDQSTGQLAFLPGDGTGKLGLPVTHFGQIKGLLFDTFYIAAADLNGDGLPDIVALDYSYALFGGINLEGQMSNSGARVYLNQGNGLFKEYQQFFADLSAGQVPSGLGIAATAAALGDIDGDGCTDAVILDTEGNATFFPGLCDGSFDVSNSRIFGSGISPGAALLADVNGDGKPDLISAAFPFTIDADYPMAMGNAVSIQLGDGAGNFAAPAIFRGEAGMYSIAAADLNGDGHLDLITANQGTDSLSVYLNDGQGGFGGPAGGYLGYLTAGQMHAVYNSPCSVLMYLDVNHDEYKDLVYLESGAQYPLPYGISVLRGDATGRFGPPIRSPILDVGVNQGIWDFALEDFRGVGLPDLLVLVWQGTPSQPNPLGYLVYSKNNGDGTFQEPVSTPFTNSWPMLFIVGDFNNDGKLDLLFYYDCYPSGSCQTPALVTFLGHGDGTFTQGAAISLTRTTFDFSIRGMLAADVNGDGKLDLLVSGNGLFSPGDDNAFYELFGNGDGTFQGPRLLFSNPGSTSYFATADFNKDGIPDLVEESVSREVIANGLPRTFRTYVGHSDGTFQLTGTFGPFPDQYAQALLFGAPDKPLWPLGPSIGDFNGDGNIDVAVYQQGVGGSYVGSEGVFTGAPLSLTLAILAGNGDGTFTPSNVGFGLGALLAPQLVGDVNGDRRADLVEMDGYTSSYDILTAQPGPSFGLALTSSPVIGAKGKLQLALAFPSGIDTAVQLSASDPNISLPATVTFPAGTVSQEVTFQIGPDFNPNRVFALTGQLGSETHTTYGTQAANAQGTGFIVVVINAPASTPVIAPSQSVGYELAIASLGGYSTLIQPSCQGLPVGAACQFSMNPIPLPPGQVLVEQMTITTETATPPGVYLPTAVFTDSLVTAHIPIPFSVGDFALSISPSSQVAPATGLVIYSLSLTGIGGFSEPVQLSVSGLPTGASTSLSGVQFPSSQPLILTVQTQNVAPGAYQFTVSGTVGSLTHSASATLQVGSADFTGSVSPTSASLSVGQSARFTVTLNSQNGATGTVSFQCLNVPSGSTCIFDPAAPTLPANGSLSDALTVQVNSRPASAPPRTPAPWTIPRGQPQTFWPLAIPLAACLVIAVALKRWKLRLSASAVSLIIVTCFLLVAESCGVGGGGSTSPLNPGPSPVTFTITVQASVEGVSTPKTLGTLTITVN